MRGEKMAKKSIGSLMRKRLSDITNTTNSHSQQVHHTDTFPSHHDSFQQLLKERTTLIQLLAERNKMIEVNGAELQRLRADMKKLQLQNWNLAQSNSHMLAELNLGRERIKTLQHEILWRAALLKGKTMDAQEKVEINYENNSTLSQSHAQEGDEKAMKPSPEASNDEHHKYKNRRRIRSRSIGSSTAHKNTTNREKNKDNRTRSRRHSATFKTHEHEPLENLFELEDATYLFAQPSLLKSSTSETKTGESCVLGSEAPSSFGRPLRTAVQKVHSYKEIPLNVKMRRLE